MAYRKLLIFIIVLFGLGMFFVQPVDAMLLVLATQPVTSITPTQTSRSTSGTPSPSVTQTAGISIPSVTQTTGTPSTPMMTPTGTATTTLVPLPEITLIFPAATPTPTSTSTILPSELTQTPQPVDNGTISHLSARIRFLIIVIAILWLILIGFVVFYVYQLK